MESAEQSQSSTSRHAETVGKRKFIKYRSGRRARCPSKEMTSPSSLCKVQLRETSRATTTNELGTEGGTGEYVRGEQEMCKRCREAFGVGPRRTLREEPVTARDEMGKVGVPAQR